MIQELLSRLYITPAVLCMAYFVTIAVPLRKPGLYAGLTLLIHQLLWAFNRFCLPEYSILWDVLTYPLVFLLLLLFAPPRQRYQAFLTQTILAVIPTLISYLLSVTVLPLAASLGVPPEALASRDGPYYSIMSLIVGCSGIAAMYGAARLLRSILKPAKETRELIWFFTIPFSQLLLTVLFVNLSFAENGFRGAPICIFLGILLSIGADIACVVGYRRYRSAQFGSFRLAEVEKMLKMQSEHFSGLQQDILSVNELRHDLKNQLQAACYLLEQGHTREVRQQLDLLDDRLSRKVGSRYCENLMVDAVLTEKARLCENKGIRLSISSPVPRQVSLDSSYLCSAFSNLLDNAIHAVLLSPSPEGPIKLSTDLRGEYLVIRCENPACPPAPKEKQPLLREHGLGLEILSRIAQLGEGSFQTEYADGVFSAVLILRK